MTDREMDILEKTETSIEKIETLMEKIETSIEKTELAMDSVAKTSKEELDSALGAMMDSVAKAIACRDRMEAILGDQSSVERDYVQAAQRVAELEEDAIAMRDQIDSLDAELCAMKTEAQDVIEREYKRINELEVRARADLALRMSQYKEAACCTLS